MNDQKVEACMELLHALFSKKVNVRNRAAAFKLLIETGYEVKYGFFKRKSQQDKVIDIAFALAFISLEAALIDMCVTSIREKIDGAHELLTAVLKYFDLASKENEKVRWFHSNFKGPTLLSLLNTVIEMPDTEDIGDGMKFTHRLYEKLIPHIVEAVDCGATRKTLNKAGESFAETIIQADFETVPKLLEQIAAA